MGCLIRAVFHDIDLFGDPQTPFQLVQEVMLDIHLPNVGDLCILISTEWGDVKLYARRPRLPNNARATRRSSGAHINRLKPGRCARAVRPFLWI